MALPSPTPTPRDAASSPRAHVQWDYEQNEPYILIPDFPTLRLTPMKYEDAEGITELCGHPQVGKFAFRRPYPFFLSDAQWSLDKFLPGNHATASSLKPHLENGTSPPPVAFPMQALRYVPRSRSLPTPPLTPAEPFTGLGQTAGPVDNTVDADDPFAGLALVPGAFLGNFHSFPSDPDPLAKPQLTDEMASKGGTMHDIAYDVMPSLWGRGLGWRGVKAMLEAWDEWVGVEIGVANIEESNGASLALVRKCGFVHVDTMTWEWPMEKGGGERTILRNEWINPNMRR